MNARFNALDVVLHREKTKVQEFDGRISDLFGCNVFTSDTMAEYLAPKDFKKFSRYRMTEAGVMEEVSASGELKHGTLIEEQYEHDCYSDAHEHTTTELSLVPDNSGGFTQWYLSVKTDSNL